MEMCNKKRIFFIDLSQDIKKREKDISQIIF